MDLKSEDFIFFDSERKSLTEKSWLKIINKIREQGPAYKAAVRIREGYQEELSSDKWESGGVSTKVNSLFDDVNHFLIQKYPAASNALFQDDFVINYNIYSHVDIKSALDENTLGVDVHVNWKISRLQIVLETGITTPISLQPEIMDMVRSGALNRSEFIKRANMDYDSVKNMKQQQHHLILDVLKSGIGGQNLMTRLVKGVLIILDLAKTGAQTVQDRIQSYQFAIPDLIHAGAEKNAAFVYCTAPTLSKHNMFLYQMCQAYPNKVIESRHKHVSIPEDGNVFLISDMKLNSKIEATMTSQEAWASLIMYATHMGVLPEVEKAMIIASSIAQNRYSKKAALPKVVSGADLVRPLMTTPPSSSAPKPMITLTMATVLGRIHQMSMLVLLKAVIISAKITSRGRGWKEAVINSLLNREDEFLSIGKNNSSLAMLAKTNEYNWWGKLDEKSVQHINQRSLFEGLWLYNQATDRFFAGASGSVVMGSYDGISENTFRQESAYATLRSELLKSGIDESELKVPTGEFTIDSPGVISLKVEEGFVEFVPEYELDIKLQNKKLPKIREEKKLDFEENEWYESKDTSDESPDSGGDI